MTMQPPEDPEYAERKKLGWGAKKGEKRGRKKGVPNKISRILREVILMAAEEAGEMQEVPAGEGKGGGVRLINGPGGLQGYLVWLARNEPRTFAHLLSRVMPYQITGDGSAVANAVVHLTKEEIVKELEERGLPIKQIFHKPPIMIEGRVVNRNRNRKRA